MEKCLLILAGGKGSRLWPISTETRPKQFLKLYSDEIMINETIRRVENLFEYKNIFIIINETQKDLAYRYVDSKIPRENIILEPEMKNTAMCIFYSTLKIKKLKGDALISILSADHYIENEIELCKNINQALEVALEDENLVTIGIKPTYPSTKFGYIKYIRYKDSNYNQVVEFKEKPNHEKAVEYLNSSEYVWNSGMFFWKIDSILKNFHKHLKDIYKNIDLLYSSIGTENEENVVKKVYSRAVSISIDKGILEKSNNIKMIKSTFEWNDVGSLDDLIKTKKMIVSDNIAEGNVILKDIKETNVINKDDNLFVIIGVDKLSVINSNNVCVICANDKINLISEVLETIKDKEEYKKYL